MNDYKSGVCAAIGNFDGVHIGHDLLIRKTKEISKKYNRKSMIITFKYLTMTLKKSNSNLKYITNYFNKINILKQYNVDSIEVIELNRDIVRYSPEKFIKEILFNRYNIKNIVVGFNFKFGYNAKGSIETLKKYEEKYNYKTQVIQPICFNNKIVSSTLIRNLITDGQIITANNLLVNNYFINFNDITYINSKIGYISLDNSIIIPKDGLYKIKIGNVHNELRIKREKLHIKCEFGKDINKNDKIEFLMEI